jgi:hypothetical protein
MAQYIVRTPTSIKTFNCQVKQHCNAGFKAGKLGRPGGYEAMRLGSWEARRLGAA